MKIGIDARLWNESGVGRYIRNLVLKLDEKKDLKHKIVVFLNSKNFRQVNFTNPGISKVLADIKWHGISEQFQFKKIIDRENLDLMHFSYFSYPVFYKKPFVITIHDLIIHHYPTGKSSTLPLPIYYAKHFAYKKITEKAVKNSLKIITPSVATRDELIDHYHADKEKIEVIYEGFDPAISISDKKANIPNNNYILYVGNAYPHKNLPVLLKAFSNLRKKINDIDLVCIGRKDYFYERLEKENHSDVHFMHEVDDSQLFEYYKHARFLVMPSLMEGFGLPVLEAMSLSVPVICSNIPALKEIAQDAALYFKPSDESELEEKMLLLLKNRKVFKELQDKGLKCSRKYSWDTALTQTLNVYESCNRL